MSNLPKFDTSKKTHYRPALRAYVPNHNASVEPPLSLSPYRYPLGLSGSEYGLYLLPNHLLVFTSFFLCSKIHLDVRWKLAAQGATMGKAGLAWSFYIQPTPRVTGSEGRRESRRSGVGAADSTGSPKQRRRAPPGGVQGATSVLACLASSNLLHERRWAPDGLGIWPNGVDESKKFKKILCILRLLH